MKIDKRKSYYIVLDVETAGTLENPLVYDLGYAVVDKKGNVYHQESFIIYEIYIGEKELMETAYYSEKLPQYDIDKREGKRKLVKFGTAYFKLKEVAERFNVKAIIAHNAQFDYSALRHTQEYITRGKYKYFLPYGVPIWCTMTMARDTIAKQKLYVRWCDEKPEERRTRGGKGAVRLTAEQLYRYISNNDNFIESHTGLEDVLIEKDIFTKCLAQHKKMRKSPYKN